MEENNAQTLLKKRARRRLVGAIFFVSLVAVFLPILMDHDPRPIEEAVEIRIPSQDDKPFAPQFSNPKTIPKPPEAPLPENVDNTPPSPPPSPPTLKKPAESLLEKPRPSVKLIEKQIPEHTEEKNKVESKADKAAQKKRDDEAKRAAAILAGKFPADLIPDPKINTKPSAEPHLVLIGAFSSEANVKGIQKKLAEINIPSFTEDLNSPQGKKIRLRAGPFTDQVAAEKALTKMQRIGINGKVAKK